MIDGQRFLVTPERPGDDPIFGIAREAAARAARGDDVVNASIGVLLHDDGSLAVLPTAARVLRELPVEELVAYAPISGLPAYLDAVIDDLFEGHPRLREHAVAVATPGGSGALRHAFSAFLEPGQSALTTSFYWGPYATIADENGRSLRTFRMFPEGSTDSLDLDALDRALGALVETQGRALLIVNDPCHNPCGYSMTERDWSGVAGIVASHAKRAPVSILLDAAYATYAPTGLTHALTALDTLSADALVLVAFTASKSFTYYGMRVGALVAVSRDSNERKRVKAALGYACRGTWSNCNRGGMAAVAKILGDPELKRAIIEERSLLTSLLHRRVVAWNALAHGAGLRYPRYDGGFFVTVLTSHAHEAAERAKNDAVFVVPQTGALRVALCAVPEAQIPRLVDSLARATS